MCVIVGAKCGVCLLVYRFLWWALMEQHRLFYTETKTSNIKKSHTHYIYEPDLGVRRRRRRPPPPQLVRQPKNKSTWIGSIAF